MAKVTFLGFASPDDPVYKTGPVIGARRFDNSSKSGKTTSCKKKPSSSKAKPEKSEKSSKRHPV